MRTLKGGLGAALALLAMSAFQAPAWASESSSENCEAERLLYELDAVEIGRVAKPASGTTVTAGSTVTFESESQWPLTFEVASSEAQIKSPDIDRGPGSESGAGTVATRYVFTSSRAAARVGTDYWAASFTVSLPNCNNEVRTFYTTSFGEKAHTLVVAAAPPSQPPPPEPPPPNEKPSHGGSTSWSGGGAGGRVGLSAARAVRFSPRGLKVVVLCTASCHGRLVGRGYLLARKGKPHPLKLANCIPRAFAIKEPKGGRRLLTCSWGKARTRKLRAILRSHRVRLILTVHAFFADRGKATTSRSLLLLGP